MVNKAKYTKSDVLRAIQGNPQAEIIAKSKGDDAWLKDLWLDDLRVSSYGHIPTIAKRLKCSDQTVRNYANQRKRLPEYRILIDLLKDIRLAIRDSDSRVYELIKDVVGINQNNRFRISDAIENLLIGLADPAAKLPPLLSAIKNKIINYTWGDFTKQAIDIQTAIADEKERGMIVRADFHIELIRDAEKALHTNIKLMDTASIKFALERLDKLNYAARSEMTGAGGKNLYDDKASKALDELWQMLDDMGKDPSEALIDAVKSMKAKLAAYKDKGKDNTHSRELGESG